MGKLWERMFTRWENWLTILRKIKPNPYPLHKQTLAPKGLKIYFQNNHEVNRKYINHCDLCVGKDFFKCKSTNQEMKQHLLDIVEVALSAPVAAMEYRASRVTCSDSFVWANSVTLQSGPLCWQGNSLPETQVPLTNLSSETVQMGSHVCHFQKTCQHYPFPATQAWGKA